jgi:hypothetical protein
MQDPQMNTWHYYNGTVQLQQQLTTGGYARIYLKITILKNYMHRARGARARSRLAQRSAGWVNCEQFRL